MIPQAHITAWRTTAPWVDDAQVEQDLVLSRAVVELFAEQALTGKISLRGGTALNKLFVHERSSMGGNDDGRRGLCRIGEFLRTGVGRARPVRPQAHEPDASGLQSQAHSQQAFHQARRPNSEPTSPEACVSTHGSHTKTTNSFPVAPGSVLSGLLKLPTLKADFYSTQGDGDISEPWLAQQMP